MSAAKVLKFIKEKEAEFVDLRFTDPRGKLQHLTMDSSVVDEGMLNEGCLLYTSPSPRDLSSAASDVYKRQGSRVCRSKIH